VRKKPAPVFTLVISIPMPRPNTTRRLTMMMTSQSVLRRAGQKNG
jgi:hypothetical protein